MDGRARAVPPQRRGDRPGLNGGPDVGHGFPDCHRNRALGPRHRHRGVPRRGERRAEPLRKAGVKTFRDLLRDYPRRYLDRSTVTPIRDIAEGMGTVSVVCTVTATEGTRRRLGTAAEVAGPASVALTERR
jgi:hypothetical protein